MKTPPLILSLIFAVMAACASAGCSSDPGKGYTLNSQFRKDVRTVAVPIWSRGRQVYRRNIEMQLTEAVIKQIELDTPYKVTSESRADTKLSGSIDAVAQQVVTVNTDTGLPGEIEITLTVSFTWTDLRTGQELVRRENFRVTGAYLPTSPMSQDFFLGNEDTINRLAKRIVEQLEAEW